MWDGSKDRASIFGAGHFFLLAGAIPQQALWFIKSLVQTVPLVLWGLRRQQRETRLSMESTAKRCEWRFTATNPNRSSSTVWCLDGVEVGRFPSQYTGIWLMCVCETVWWSDWWLLRGLLLCTLALLKLGIVCCYEAINFLFFGPNRHESIGEEKRLVFSVK
jgi:hypothetical protein